MVQDAAAAKTEPIATARDEEHALIRAAQAGDLEARNQLILSHLGFCWKQARYWKRRIKSHSEDDLAQIAVLGLIKAVETFDLSKGFAFLTYASRAIHTEITRQARTTDGLITMPVYTFMEKTKRTPPRILSLDYAHPTDSGDVHGLVADDTPATAALREAISQLPERRKYVLTSRMDGKTLQEIADVLGVSRERVRQVELEAIGEVTCILVDAKLV